MLQAVSKKTKMSLDHAHFKKMHEMMLDDNKNLPLRGEDYLYRRMYRFVRYAETKETDPVDLNVQNVEAIAKYLGFISFKEFLDDKHLERNQLLKSCIGDWYSYVRCNSGSNDILVSPAAIYAKGKEIYMELKGPHRSFTGVVKLNGQCLFCFLESGKEKNLHLVLKFGFSDKPEILQGVFSGLSTGGDPIAGREVFIRYSGKEEDKPGNQKLKLKVLLASEDKKEKTIARYFNDRSKNILSGGKASTFGWEDLEEKDAEE
ncbi:MAG: hypothetical protein M3R17_13905 [Bacteroidota bacterium]|nr:hypothetical protein [Bacteroidota bacterium]